MVENMDRVLTNSGLIHIKDQIFEELDNSTFAACLLVCKDWYDALTTDEAQVAKISGVADDKFKD